MSEAVHRVVYWSPRALTLLFAAFLSLFALDVFQEGQELTETLLALAVHLVPVYLVLGGLALAWRWEWVGAILFGGLGVAYLMMAWESVHWTAFLAISGPLFLVAILFLLSWRLHGRP